VVWCGVVWCGVVWCGVVWCGVVWCGVVWCGVVWCDEMRWDIMWIYCNAKWCEVAQLNCIHTHWNASDDRISSGNNRVSLGTGWVRLNERLVNVRQTGLTISLLLVWDAARKSLTKSALNKRNQNWELNSIIAHFTWKSTQYLTLHHITTQHITTQHIIFFHLHTCMPELVHTRTQWSHLEHPNKTSAPNQ